MKDFLVNSNIFAYEKLLYIASAMKNFLKAAHTTFTLRRASEHIQKQNTNVHQGRLKLWTSDLRAFFLNLNPARKSKNGSNII